MMWMSGMWAAYPASSRRNGVASTGRVRARPILRGALGSPPARQGGTACRRASDLAPASVPKRSHGLAARIRLRCLAIERVRATQRDAPAVLHTGADLGRGRLGAGGY